MILVWPERFLSYRSALLVNLVFFDVMQHL